ncbi:MAG: hypothetical protein J6D18_00860, partial [Erysipelotrichaceae bacterium]|nr:hypothetical protein [Erysipelotrichaceae bacterium]
MSALTNMDEFWAEFAQQEPAIRDCLAQNEINRLQSLVTQLEEKVNAITGAHFFLEFAYDNFEMTFDTGPNKTTQYLAKLCVDRAPKEIKKNWILNACLPPLSQKAVQAQIKMKEQSYDLSDFYAFYSVNEQAQSLDVRVYCPGYALIGNPERKKEMSMYVVELAVGMLTYESYLTSIDFTDTPLQDHSFCALVDFYETVTDIVQQNQWNTYASVTDIYSVFQPNQDIVHDALRKDMKYIFTTHPVLIEELLLDQVRDCREDCLAKGAQFQTIYYTLPYHNEQDAQYRRELSKKLSEVFSESSVAALI